MARDYDEVSDKMKIGILVRMVPGELQQAILHHADRLNNYRAIREKVLSLADARRHLKDPDAMDIDGVDNCGNDGWEEQDIAAVGKGACFRCGGVGHRAADCATPAPLAAKGKGDKGKGKGAVWGEKGKGKGNGKGGVRPQCAHCGKTGHTPETCWSLHPDQMPWKRTNGIDWDEAPEEREIGQVDVEGRVPGLHRGLEGRVPGLRRGLEGRVPGHHRGLEGRVGGRPARGGSFGRGVEAPPGIELKNSFAALAVGDECDVEERVFDIGAIEEVDNASLGALDIEVDDQAVAHVGRSRRLVSAGRGKITIDSGAAESVLPRGMLPNEPLREGAAKRSGVKYVAANGARMETLGEKRARFRRSGEAGINGITFQVTDVAKPLAAVSRILDKGNRVVFNRGAEGSYIENVSTGEWMPLKEEKGTFVLEVDFLQPEEAMEEQAAAGFARRGE